MSDTARLNAAALAADGLLKPDSLRTNCSADAWISSRVAGGSKLTSFLMLRHMDQVLTSTCSSRARAERSKHYPPAAASSNPAVSIEPWNQARRAGAIGLVVRAELRVQQ